MGKTYFISDFHLGAPNYNVSRERENFIVSFLQTIQYDADEIYLMGDVFDFWFEYKYVVPKGFIRLLGCLAQLADSGVKLFIFTGNHDFWMNDYLTKELNAEIIYKPIFKKIKGAEFYLAHGDGLGPGDKGYKFIKKVFANPICKFLFRWIHPDIGFSIANYFSRKSRLSIGADDSIYLGEDKEWLIIHTKEVLAAQPTTNYCVYGHRHYPLMMQWQGTGSYVNLGDWIKYNSYGVWDGEHFELKFWK
ncbi:MAG: UDP-2,3-diacylglucosamine diphosphatase [Bacteroidota bacterium]|nr:UDP-2,3-diacylglucosamine diphosphatase [Bacteroidota bacterium]